MEINMKNLLIIGGFGLLGSELVKFFPNAYYTYNSTKIKDNRAYRLDITDQYTMLFLFIRLDLRDALLLLHLRMWIRMMKKSCECVRQNKFLSLGLQKSGG